MNEQIKSIKCAVQGLQIQATEQNVMLLAEIMIRLNKLEEESEVTVDDVQVVPEAEVPVEVRKDV